MPFAPAVALALGLASTLPLSVQLAPGVPCLDQPALTGQLATRQVTPADPGWRLQLLASEGTPGRLVRLVRMDLRRPDGGLALSRLLEMDPRRCQGAAELVALVLERYFRELAWAGPGGPPTSAVIEPAGPPPPATVTVAAAPSPPSPRGRPVLAVVGPMVWSRYARSPLVAAELRVGLTGPFHARLGLLVPGAAERQALPGGGQARLSAWPILLGALYERRHRSLAAQLGAELMTSIEQGQSSGIATPARERRLMLAAGSSLGLAWLFTPRLRVVAEAGLLRLGLGRDFEVQGFGPVLVPPPWQGHVALRLGWVLSQ